MNENNVTRAERSWALSTGSERPPDTLYIRIAVDYSQWNATSPLLDDLASFDLYMMAADTSGNYDSFADDYFLAVTPFPLHRNAHLRGTVNIVVRRVILPSWLDFIGLKPVRVNLYD